ncbi:MAG: hypothetical protein ABSC50_04380 [Candidatus Bathyarchaeia archaeon]
MEAGDSWLKGRWYELPESDREIVDSQFVGIQSVVPAANTLRNSQFQTTYLSDVSDNTRWDYGSS